ncbi:hypothetical protein COV16_00185 [Candidatus Woesearchaeota archaeon CG10_big_fil_rev_8_21_14_0_10_34_8]|nr:MAG: hypothetical protein COV16_00185 [Candidatus Woesearchaeota archaeon CG10_big_fil_rev_8_21_14_0_10_34_8]
MRFIKQKAVFMIYLTLSLLFTIYLMPAAAQEVEKACCEQSNSGDTCLYTETQNCDNNYRIGNFQKCEDTSFCKVGCCVDKDGGSCSKSTSKATCEAAGFDWNSNTDCSQVKECDKGCCVLGGASCAYNTERKCDAILLDYPELVKDFRSAETELQCSNICREADKGCCVQSTNEDCIWTSRVSCGLDDGVGLEGFYQDISCSNTNLKCEQCRPKYTKGCLDGTEDVYWFDSCGNPEGIAEDCDYAKGTLCGETEDKEFVCKSVHCSDTWDNPVVDGDGGTRINGESWCEYDGAIGPTLDLPGSRHSRHICINGEELVEGCKDFREEICIQADVYEEFSTGVIESDQGLTSSIKGEFLFSSAGCRDNRWKDCTTTCNTANEKTDANEIKIAIQLDKKCCERSDIRDCVWNGDEETGICIPLHPPGFKFWATDVVNILTTDITTQTITEDKCSVATKSCTTVFTKMIYTNWEWACMKDGNCECYDDDYIESQNNYCRSIGDCGAHYNYIGDFTNNGFTRVWDKGYQGWDIIFDRAQSFQTSYYNKESKEPKITVDKDMVGAFEEVWQNADSSVYVKDVINPDTKQAQIGIGVATATITLVTGILKAVGGAAAKSAAAWIGPIGVFVVAYFLLTEIALRKYEKRTVQTTCGVWQPPSGGYNCEKCNGEFSVCSEYKCKSLGANCKFIEENEGTARDACVNADPNDVTRPQIKPWKETLEIKNRNLDITFDYNIVESQTSYTIAGKKIPAFSSVTFGIETNEPSNCRLDTELKQTYKDLSLRFNEEYYDSKHNFTIRNLIPATDYKYYIICKDTNDNPKDEEPTAPYVVEFSTDNSPDLEPPRLISASVPDLGYVSAKANETNLRLLIDEVSPFGCKASKEDTSFDQMQMNMTCLAMPQNSLFSEYAECQIQLPVTIGQNIYYFRCRDEPENSQIRNENSESYIWRATKAEELYITAASPVGKIYDTNVTLQVSTTSGPQDGKAICYFDNIEFFETNASYHTQILSGLTKQDYSYRIECKDVANNKAVTQIDFTVDLDLEPSEIVLLHRSGPNIILNLNEDATCEYSTEDFIYGEGTLTGTSTKIHSVYPDMLKEKFSFKCKDKYGNLMQSVIYTKIDIKPSI